MGEIYSKGTSFTTPTCVKAWVEYPFRNLGDSTTKLYHHIMQVKASSYTVLADDDVMTTAGQKPARSPFSDDSGAYYVGDYNLSPIDNGLIEFDRQFSNIPQDRTNTNGIYAFDLLSPLNKLSYEVTGSPAFTITGGLGTWGCTFTLSASHHAHFQVGDIFQIDYGSSSGTHFLTTNLLGDTTENERFLEWIITNKSGSNYTASLLYPNGFTALSKGSSTNWVFERIYFADRTNLNAINSASFINYRYVKTNDVSAVSLKKRFNPINTDGQTVTVLENTGGNTTSPSIDAWAGEIDSGAIVAAEDETIARWKGNIYELYQIMVKAV